MSLDTIQPGRTAVAVLDPPPARPAAPKNGPSTLRRLRRQAAPHYAVGLLMIAASMARAAVFLGGDEGTVAAATAVVAFVGAVVGSTLTIRRIHTPQVRAWALACVGAAATWLVTVASLGLSVDAAGVLALLGYGLALPWWRTHRDSYDDGKPKAVAAPVEVVPEGPVEPHMFVKRWKAKIAAPQHPVAGSHLVLEEVLEHGPRFVVHLVAGMQDFESVNKVQSKLRSGLGLHPLQELIIERHPDLDESHLRLTIVTDPQILQGGHVPWPGPAMTYRDGASDLGPFIDGQGAASWRTYTENSMHGGFVGGSTGTGKTVTLEALVLSILGSPDPTTLLYSDGQAGASSPMLDAMADWSACRDDLESTVAATKIMLACVLAIMKLRQAENKLFKLSGFTPSPERPGILIVLDECHDLFADPEIQAMCLQIARKGRKLGIVIIAATQSVTLEAFGQNGASGDVGKGADTLRGSLMAGNTLLMRLMSNNPANMLKLPNGIDPFKFPEIPGYAHYITRDKNRRSAPLRTYLVSKDQQEYWSTRIQSWPLDNGAANAAGKPYANRVADRDAVMEDLADFVEQMHAGTYTPPTPTYRTPSPVAPTPETATPASTSWTTTATGMPSWGAAPVPMPTWPSITLPPRQAAPAPAGPGVGVASLSKTERGVYDVVAAHPGTPSEILAAAGELLPVAERQFKTILAKLALPERGVLRNDGTGSYSVLADADHH